MYNFQSYFSLKYILTEFLLPLYNFVLMKTLVPKNIVQSFWMSIIACF